MTDKPIVALDTECYRNFWLLKLKRRDNGATREWRLWAGGRMNVREIRSTLDRCTLITFNGNHYDMPMIGYALSGATTEQLKALSDAIIVGGMKPWEVERQFGFTIPKFDHIDIIEIMPGMVSLKVYGGRMHCRRMQDLPIEPDAFISASDGELLSSYCENDLDVTLLGYNKFLKEIDLRGAMSREYGMDLRSKSDAQIAEAVLKARIGMLLQTKITRPENVPRSFQYKPPAFLSYESEVMRGMFAQVCATIFRVNDKGAVDMPEALSDAAITIGQGVYRMGIGGLHSSESCAAHVTDDEYLIVDRDVASYYPAIILNCGLFPRHLGRHFLHVYRDIRDKRLQAKAAGNKSASNTLKILLNGTFGKLGSKWSALYAPDLMIQVTITGQLALLMLIERIEAAGIRVVSANTDGIVIKCRRSDYDRLGEIINGWEHQTGFETEETRYRALYSRDVNNYIALKEGGGVKLKGAYAEPEPVASSWPSPHNQICVTAVCDYLEHGIPIDLTIMACHDIRQFVEVRNVTGGATWRGQYLGKAVRWYLSTDGEPIRYRKQNKGGEFKKVASTDRARPLMELPDTIPDDLDHAAYIAEAHAILRDIGAA